MIKGLIVCLLTSITIAHRYVVQVDYEKATDLIEDHTFNNLNVLKTFSANGNHYLVVECDDHVSGELSMMNHVLQIQDDELLQPTATCDRTETYVQWGLNRINQHDLPLDSDWVGDGSSEVRGDDIDVYIVDTGINENHPAFSTPPTWFGAYGTDTSFTDCHGHGTHVAGTVGGTDIGVANGVNLFAVKIADSCSGGAYSTDMVTAINAVRTSMLSSGRKSVINLSYTISDIVKDALNDFVAAGGNVALAAGNSASDYCGLARYADLDSRIMVVGAMTSSDAKSSFSNYGSCVNIWAPGSTINSAQHSSSVCVAWQGTSMAAPHVAGVFAVYYARNPSMTNTQLSSLLLSEAVTGRLSGLISGDNNVLLQVDPSGTTPTPPPTPSPTPVPTPGCDPITFEDMSVSNTHGDIPIDYKGLTWPTDGNTIYFDCDVYSVYYTGCVTLPSQYGLINNYHNQKLFFSSGTPFQVFTFDAVSLNNPTNTLNCSGYLYGNLVYSIIQAITSTSVTNVEGVSSYIDTFECIGDETSSSWVLIDNIDTCENTCKFGMYDYSDENDVDVLAGGWSYMSLLDVQTYETQLINYYNTNGGLDLIKPWQSTNCCFKVKDSPSGEYLFKDGSYVYPATPDGISKCNPTETSVLDYIDLKYILYSAQTGIPHYILTTSNWTTDTSCGDNNNPGIYMSGNCDDTSFECCEVFTDIGHQDGANGFTEFANITSNDACCALCRADSQCEGWTLAGPNFDNTCFLYDTPSDGVTIHVGCSSGNPTNDCPTPTPTDSPTLSPTDSPTPYPTTTTTLEPTPNPTDSPTPYPTLNPTDSPTPYPTTTTTLSPTPSPTLYNDFEFTIIIIGTDCSDDMIDLIRLILSIILGIPEEHINISCFDIDGRRRLLDTNGFNVDITSGSLSESDVTSDTFKENFEVEAENQGLSDIEVDNVIIGDSNEESEEEEIYEKWWFWSIIGGISLFIIILILLIILCLRLTTAPVIIAQPVQVGPGQV